MRSHLTAAASARTEFLDARTGGTVCAGVAAYAIRSASALSVAYNRAEYLRALTINFYQLQPLLSELIPSPSRRPTHFLLFQIGQTPVFKGVFCFHECDIQAMCDRLVADLAKDWSKIEVLPPEDRKRHCCKLTIGHWLIIGNQSTLNI